MSPICLSVQAGRLRGRITPAPKTTPNQFRLPMHHHPREDIILSRNPALRAAVHIMDASVLASRDLRQLIDWRRGTIDLVRLQQRAAAYSGGETRLTIAITWIMDQRTSIKLWGAQHACVQSFACGLDETNSEVLWEALDIAAGRAP